jgi:hypothetical protein
MKKTIFLTTIAMLTLFGATTYFTGCKPDACVTRAVDCKNGGTCRDGECLCALGYEGDSCQFRVNQKFDSHYACIRTKRFNNTFNEDNDDTLRVIAQNDRFSIKFYSIRDSVFEVWNAKVDGNYITLPTQTLTLPFTVVTYNGTGSLNNGVLTMTINSSWDNGGPMTAKTTYVGYKYE